MLLLILANGAPKPMNFAPLRPTPRDFAQENGTRVQKVSINSMRVRQSTATNKYVPIVLVVLVIGCAKCAIKLMSLSVLPA